MSRAMSVTQLISKKRKLLPFEGEWLEAIGKPEVTGSWMIWAESANGKTGLTLKLCKYLCKFGRVLYNSLEEGDSESMKHAVLRADMQSVKNRFTILNMEPIPDMLLRLKKKKAPRFVVIDSLQYAELNKREYKKMISDNPKTLFIIISHARGKKPADRLGDAVRYHSMVKIRVEGYKAFVQSRYREGEGKPIIIWDKGAQQYWGI